jgi:hypothetical protein
MVAMVFLKMTNGNLAAEPEESPTILYFTAALSTIIALKPDFP